MGSEKAKRKVVKIVYCRLTETLWGKMRLTKKVSGQLSQPVVSSQFWNGELVHLIKENHPYTIFKILSVMEMVFSSNILFFFSQPHFFFFFNKFIYLFIYLIFGCIGSSLLHAGFLQLLRAGATLCCGAWASRCGGFSYCRARALGTWVSAVVAHRLQSAASVVVAHGLSCSGACGIFPDQGLNPCPLHWQVDS